MRKVQATLPPGTIIEGRYVIEGVLGTGRSGAVYMVRDLRVHQHLFALKEISNLESKEEYRFSFEPAEFQKFVHPALPRIYKVFHDDEHGRVYILMDYIEGSSLEEARQLQPEQRFSLPQTLTLIAPIMDAAIHLHSQHPPFIHGHINPSNMIEATSASIILVGFDIEKEYDAEKTIAVAPHTRPGFEAPEQYIGRISPRTDIYALGATLYVLLTGTVPVGALHRLKKISKNGSDPLVQLNQFAPAVLEPVGEIIHRAMAMSSDDRFLTVEQFWEALQQASNASPVEQQTTVPAVEAPNEEKIESEPHSQVQQMLEPPAGIEEASTLAIEPTVYQSPEPAAISLDPPHTAIISGTFKSRVTRPLQEPTQARRFKQSGILLLTMFALLVTLFGSVGVGASLWYYIVHYGSHSATSNLAVPLKATPHPNPTSTLIPTPSTSSAHIAELYYGSIYDIPKHVTTEMALTDIHQTQKIIRGNFTGLQKAGTFNGSIYSSKHFQFIVKDSSGHSILSFDGAMQSDGNLSGSYCNVDQVAQCTGEYGLWSVTPAS